MSNSDYPVSYVRRVYYHTFDWYKNAQTKAQIIFTIDGVFLAFVTGSIFMKRTDLFEIIRQFTPFIWLLLSLMSLSLIGSIISAIVCIWSRIPFSSRAKMEYLSENKIQLDKLETYKPDATLLFQKISWLNPNVYLQYLAEQ